MANVPSRSRLPEFDVLRGAAIIGVVYLHAYFTPWPEASSDGLIALHVAHLFAHGAVPLFLFISAYFQARGPELGPGQLLRRRAATVWAPVLLWMAASLGYRLYEEGSSAALWKDFALFNISGQFYFAWLLLVFDVALTQARRIKQNWLLPVVAAAFVINLGTIAWYDHHGAITGMLATLAYRNPAAWVFFPVAGYALGRAGVTGLSSRGRNLALLTMAIAGAVYFWNGAVREDWPVSYFGVTVFLFNSAAMFIYPQLASKLVALPALARPLTGLSRYAFAIYLVHLPFAMGLGTRQLLGDGATWSNYWLLLHANALVGLVVSLAMVALLDRTYPRLARILLGIRGPRGGPESRTAAS
jgi:peptidoglycan/LPS O-acetylase OafA/YrhL